MTNKELLKENAFLKQRIQELEQSESERKRAEEEFNQKESLNYALFEYNPEQAIAVDLEGKIIAVNLAKRMSGDRLPDIGDVMYRDYASSHEIDMYSELMECLGSGKLKLFPEQKYRNKYLSVTIAPFSMGAVILSEDITERKRAEESLRESNKRYRTIVENCNDALYIHDFKGNILDLNENACRMLGYTPNELAGGNLGIIDSEENKRALPGRMDRLLIERSILFEGSHVRKDGTIIPVEVSAKVVSREGNGIIQGFVRDITERKRMEEELLKADKLESVGILAGGIAHDFNNILTSISGNISMAKMQVEPGNKIFDLLSAAEKASARAQRLTSQLLTFAKGGKPLRETVFFKKHIKESSLFVLQGSKSICEFHIAEDLWPVEADVGQIGQVISNIVINANQAMPEGGTIQITAKNLMPEEMREIPLISGRYISISIKDQGIGVAEKHLSKLFDPYFTTKHAGSGLGLATAYSIIKKHNGHISVNSLPGAGTTFDIYLPASDKEIPVKEEAVLLTGCGKILIMDDDESLKALMMEMLDMLGYESAVAKNGAEAIEMYKKTMESGKPYDAVILDLTIPGGMGGEEVIKILLKIDPEVKAIVFSGYSESEVMSNFRKYGFKGMMPKPFDTYALGKVLNDVLKD